MIIDGITQSRYPHVLRIPALAPLFHASGAEQAEPPHELPEVLGTEVLTYDVNPGLINHGSLIRGYSPKSHDLILFLMVPSQLNSRKRGLLVQG